MPLSYVFVVIKTLHFNHRVVQKNNIHLENTFMQGLVLINIVIEWLEFKTKSFHVEFNFMFPYWCCYVPEYHEIL